MSEISTTKAPPLNATAPLVRPRFSKIPPAMAYSGIGRTKLYELAGSHPGLFRKSGASTLVDMNFLDRILDGLPAAAIRSSSATR